MTVNSERKRYPGADAIRIIAFAMVILYHIDKQMEAVWGRPYLFCLTPNRLFGYGRIANTMFFALSGAMIYISNKNISIGGQLA